MIPSPPGLGLRGQRGFTSMEMLMAGFLGVLMLVCGGYLFTTQVRGYTDIRDQARIQADVKKAMQAITRQISNAGACLPDPRHGFSAAHDRLSFEYVDVKKRFCDDEDDVLNITLYSKPEEARDYLIQEIRCPGKPVLTRTLAEVPGGVDLAFNYVDRHGSSTMDVSKIKAVELDLSLHTRKTAGRPVRTRTLSLQVDCPNLL